MERPTVEGDAPVSVSRSGRPGVHPVGSQLPVRRAVSGAAYLEIRDLGPSEALVLVNRP